ncbi:AAA family ATPase [Alcaligenes endophyticus]|uniref:AAA family ATPase n=1 Tax=Alcaligenes endophyticus TaxID=1929088 RepID=A0ABT8EJR3_9BURK|nr:AAA family ATPase [Alcaligenes endophyticus]MCX5591830.1 AAA family ATPase [Alcaligenes endophyticus]MDN4121507.1 AAA family ATPase [Alcaligenes endophyticus]
MQILSLTLQQFRRFEQAVELRDLHAGLNIIAGPNEAGKSTLAQAIRVAFFERHSTGSGPLKSLLPWGDSTAAPEVTVRFCIADKQYTLQKRFFKARRCFLDFAGQRLEGEQAEQHLAELLGYEYANRGASDKKNWGVPGLLWIEQGQGQDLREAVLAAGATLQQALGQHVAELGSSDGEELIERVKRELFSLRTEVQGSPKGDWLASLRQQEELQTQLKEWRAQLQQYQQGVDELSRLKTLLQRHEKEQPWQAMLQQQQAAEAKLAQAQAFVKQEESLCQQLELLRLNLGRLQDGLLAQQEKQVAFNAKQEQLHSLLQSLPGIEQQRDHLHSRFQQACQDRDQYETYREQARQWQLWQAQKASHQAAMQEHERLGRRLLEATKLDQQIATLSALIHQEPVQADAIKQAKALQTQLQRWQLQLEAQAPELWFDLQAQAELQLGQERLQGQGKRLLSQTAIIDLGAAGTVRIVPAAASNTEALHSDIQHCRQQLNSLLESLAAQSIEELERRWEIKQERVRDLQHDQNTLMRHAPHGVSALQQQAQALILQLTEAPRQPEITVPDGIELSQADMLEQEFQARKNRAQALEEEWRPLREQVQQHVLRIQALESDIAAQKELLSDPSYLLQQQDRRMQAQALQEQERVLIEQIAQAKQHYNDAGADLLRQDITRYARSAIQFKQDYEQAREDLLVLQTKLESQGVQGLDEKIADHQGQLELVQKRNANYARRAAALQLLLDTLQSKRRDLTERLLQPLQSRMLHYLRFLPQAKAVILDQHFAPTGLQRDAGVGLADVVEDLSFGTREQLGLMARLAYADLLQEAGHPTFLMLDDVLVHSDEQRLEQMKRMLTDAALRHQIVLFTCQEEKWQDMGVRIQRLPQALQ